MNFSQLFEALPRDLQWEILSVFVGSHSVRKGVLIRKLVRDFRFNILENIAYIRLCNLHAYTLNWYAKSIVIMDDGSELMYCESAFSGESGVLFRKRQPCNYPGSWYWRIRFTLSAVPNVILPPYVKHSFPSYPDTDKKKNEMLLTRAYF